MVYFCESLACHGGAPGTCQEKTGEWSGRAVTCGQALPRADVWLEFYDGVSGTAIAIAVADPLDEDGEPMAAALPPSFAFDDICFDEGTQMPASACFRLRTEGDAQWESVGCTEALVVQPSAGASAVDPSAHGALAFPPAVGHTRNVTLTHGVTLSFREIRV